MGGFLHPDSILSRRTHLPCPYDPTTLIDGRAAIISERFNEYLPPDWSLIQLKINYVKAVASHMRKNNLPATSGGSPNISGWLHICTVLGGGVNWHDWQDLNEFEQEALIQEVNEHNRQQEKRHQQETENMKKELQSIQSENSPSMFNNIKPPSFH